MMTPTRLLASTLAALGLFSVAAHAQTGPPPVAPPAPQVIVAPGGSPVNNNMFPAYYGRYGGALMGASQVMQAANQGTLTNEQARIERQKYYQEKIHTKKMAFDQMQYEKANTPSYTEDQEVLNSKKLRRLMGQPNPYELARGDTLNAMLNPLRSLSAAGGQGPPQPLNPAILRQINVAPTDGSGVGVLRNGGKISWPLACRGETQKKLDRLIPAAISATVNGSLQPEQYSAITSGIITLREEMRKKFQTDVIDSPSYIAGKRFVEDLERSVRSLQRPDAAKFFDGTYAAHGRNVPELVAYMTDQGLQFSPASPGGEAAYRSLHSSFVGYVRSTQAATGFIARNVLPNSGKGPR